MVGIEGRKERGKPRVKAGFGFALLSMGTDARIFRDSSELGEGLQTYFIFEDLASREIVRYERRRDSARRNCTILIGGWYGTS